MGKLACTVAAERCSEQINADQRLLPGIELGAIVLDTCDSPLHAAEQAVDLLQGFMYRKALLPNLDIQTFGVG